MTTCYCKTCGYVGKRTETMSGSLGIEIVLWLCFLLPGLIYSLWRFSAIYPCCAKCGGREVIPSDSPLVPAAFRRIPEAETNRIKLLLWLTAILVGILLVSGIMLWNM